MGQLSMLAILRIYTNNGSKLLAMKSKVFFKSTEASGGGIVSVDL